MSREGLWKILIRLGCPPKFLTILRLHDGQLGRAKLSGNLSDSVPVSNGVKQGCILAPTLFSIFFSMMITQAKINIEYGIYVRFRIDGSILNLRCPLARTKIHHQLVLEFLYADDCALLAHTEDSLQRIVDCFAKAATVQPHHQPEEDGGLVPIASWRILL